MRMRLGFLTLKSMVLDMGNLKYARPHGHFCRYCYSVIKVSQVNTFVHGTNYYLGAIETFVPILSVAVLRSAWVETDPGVRRALLQPVLIFLKGNPILIVLALNFPNHCSRVSQRLGA